MRRAERDELRDIEGELLVVVAPATQDERILRADVRLTRDARRARFALGGDGLSAVSAGAAAGE